LIGAERLLDHDAADASRFICQPACADLRYGLLIELRRRGEIVNAISICLVLDFDEAFRKALEILLFGNVAWMIKNRVGELLPRLFVELCTTVVRRTVSKRVAPLVMGEICS
jgi:hypothetical protein